MATSSTHSWLQSPLQSQSAQHGLYSADLPMHTSAHLNQHPHVDFGQQDHPCDTFCQPLHDTDFRHTADNPLQDFSGPAGASSSSGGVGLGVEKVARVSARKIHKADREKLRRDRLNEQFSELARALDPDRPKNDKATILGGSVQVVKELHAEVKRLRNEQAALLDESRDLGQEKTELREEKAALKSETEHLQGQVQQRLRMMIPWMAMDQSLMMGGATFPYSMTIPQPVSSPSVDASQASPQVSLPQPVPAYIPMAAAPPGAFAIHPGLQAYALYGNRPGDGSAPYLAYPHYPPQVSSHSHVERPYAQYPSPVQPLPAYLMQMQPHQGQPPISGPGSPPMYRPYGQGMPMMPSQTSGNQQPGHPRGMNPHVYAHYGAPGMQMYLNHSGPIPVPQQCSAGQSPPVPLLPHPHHHSKETATNSVEELAKSGSSSSESDKECKTSEHPSIPGTDDPLLAVAATSVSAGQRSTCTSSSSSDTSQVDGDKGREMDSEPREEEPKRRRTQQNHDPSLRPAAA